MITWYQSEDLVTGVLEGRPVVQIERLEIGLWQVIPRSPIRAKAFVNLGHAKRWASRQIDLVTR